MSRHERDDLGVSYVHREIKETKGRSANQKIRSIYVCMASSSPSKQTAGMNKEQNRMIRKKYCNSPCFSSPGLHQDVSHYS